MLADTDIIAFVPTRNFDAARAFYGETLGLRFLEDDGFALVFDAGGTMLRIVKVPEFTPFPFTILGWKVANISEMVTKLEANGVVFERYPFLEQDALGIWSSPSGARVAWFKDPGGSTLSLSQHP